MGRAREGQGLVGRVARLDPRSSTRMCVCAGADGVSAFLGLTAEDGEALRGYADVFGSGEPLGPTDAPTSLTDGFPSAIKPN